jgi:hypothetical protein
MVGAARTSTGSNFFSRRDLPGSGRISQALRPRIWCSGRDFNKYARLHLFCIILRVWLKKNIFRDRGALEPIASARRLAALLSGLSSQALAGKHTMTRIISAAVAAGLVGILTIGQPARVAAKTRRYSAQPWQSYSYSSDQSWRLYPYYNGAYKGRPVSEWLRPGTW